jgi:HAD superfamily hydrolase (TIGR01509 family)
MAIVERYESQAADRTKLLPCVREALEELRRMGLKLVLFTADGDEAMNAIVEKTAIRHLFDELVSRGSSIEVKPHPKHVASAMARSNATSEEVVVVGDSVVDILSGKHIDAITVGVTTGLSSRQSLAEAGADYLVDSIIELPPLIRRLRGECDCQSATR